MRLPALWRKKRGPRFVGSYHVTWKTEDINLGTSDAEEASKRRREAVHRGRRNFVDELDQVAQLEEGGASSAPALGDGHEPPPESPAASPAPPAPSSPSPPPPDPPPAPAAAAEAPEDMAAAAAEVTGGPANDNAPPEVIDGAALDAILEPAALVVVDAQLRLQAALVKRYTGKVAAEVPLDSPLRTAAAKAWAMQLRIWFPADRMLPAWAMALLLPTLAIPAQLAGATQPPEESGVREAQVVK